MVAEYLQNMPLPAGSKFKDINMKIEGGKLVTNGLIAGGFGGESSFDIVIEQDPSTGKLKVVNRNIRPAFIHKPFVGQIENNFDQIDQRLTELLNERISSRWEVQNLGIAEDQLVMNFKKKSSGFEEMDTGEYEG